MPVKTDAQPKRPAPGWHGRAKPTTWINPRPPAAPGLIRNLEEYYAAAVVMGLVASQSEEPNKEWAAEWALDVGEIMAKKARQRWG